MTADWAATELEKVDRCPVCGGTNRKLLHEGLKDSAFGVAPGRWNIYTCLSCRSGFLDPRPTPASIGRAYANYYTHDLTDSYVVRRRNGVRGLVHDLLNGYQNHRYGVRREHALGAGRWLVPLLVPLRSAADAELRHLSPAPRAGANRLLDIGCGSGAFLALARTAGWEVEGLDFDPGAVETARQRGLVAHQGDIRLLADRKSCFDVITLSHVLEHVYDPAELLSSAFRLLVPGGTLWVETPNVSSLGHRKFGPHWRGLESPRHLMLFSREGLLQMVRAAGFRHLSMKSHGVVATSVYISSSRIRSVETGQPEHSIRALTGAALMEVRELFEQQGREYLTLVATK